MIPLTMDILLEGKRDGPAEHGAWDGRRLVVHVCMCVRVHMYACLSMCMNVHVYVCAICVCLCVFI